MGMVLIYDDFAENAVFAGGAWDATLPLGNLKKDDVGLIAQASSLATSATQFTVDLGKPRAVGGVVIGPGNFGPGATAVITAYSDAAMATPAYTSGLLTGTADSVDWSDTGDWLAWEDPDFWLGIKTNDPEVEALPFYFDHVLPASVSGLYRYWKVEISDPSNPTGRMRIGRAIFGRAYRPKYNYGYGDNEFGVQWVTDKRTSLMGRNTFWARYSYRRVRFGWSALPQEEAFGDWFRLAARSGIHKQVYIISQETDDGAMRRKRSFLATLTEVPAIKQVVYRHVALALQADEVI